MSRNVTLVTDFLIFNCSAGLGDDDHATVDRRSFAAAICALYTVDPWTTILALLEHTWSSERKDRALKALPASENEVLLNTSVVKRFTASHCLVS